MKKLLLSLAAVAAVSGMGYAQTAENPYTVDQYLEKYEKEIGTKGVYVTGYIVGSVDTSGKENQWVFGVGTAPSNTNLLLAGSSAEDEKTMVVTVQLPSGKVRDALNLQAHPENLGHQVTLCGDMANYFSVTGLKNTSSYSWVGDTPVVPESKTYGTADAPISVTDLLAIPVIGVNYAYVQGYIVGAIKDGAMDLNNPEFGTSGVAATMILVAPTATTTNVAECIPVRLGTSVRPALNLADNPGNLGKNVMIYGTYGKYFGVPGITEVMEYKLGEGGGDNPNPPVVSDIVYNKDLKSEECGFTWVNNEINDGQNYVWSISSKYGLKASAYISDTNYVADAYAVSPVLDLTNREAPVTVDFSQAANFFKGTFADAVSVVVREEGTTAWTVVPGLSVPESDSWAFNPVATMNLDQYAGKKIQLGFRYTSTDKVAGTWEIDKLVVKAPAKSAVSAIESAEGEAVYFNLQGVRVVNPENGLYIKVVNGKSQKVLVK